MDRIKPHLTRVGIALRIPRHNLAAIRQMKSEDDAVYTLLDAWLHGQDDLEEDNQRSITWATLIGALKEANLQEEAKILEHIVEANEPQSSELLCFTQQ